MKAEQIQQVIDDTFATPRAGWGTESLQALAIWEVALQLAIANEREAAKPKSIFPDLTKTGTQLPTVWNSPMPMAPVFTPPTTVTGPFVSGLSPVTVSTTPTTPAAPATLCQHTSE